MKPEDRERFVTAMGVMAEAFQKKPSEALAEIYFKSLEDMDIETFERACSTLINTRTITGTFPLVAEIREAVGGGKQALELRIIQAWDKLMYAVQRHGYYDSVLFDDPIIPKILESWGGWIEWSSGRQFEGQPDGLKWVRKDFSKMYAAMASREWPAQEKPCIGFVEHKNTLGGFSEHIPAPYFIRTYQGRLTSQQMPSPGLIGHESSGPDEELSAEIRKVPCGSEEVMASEGPYPN